MKLANQIVKSKWFEDFARQAAYRMITHTRSDTANSWREAARKSSRGREIFEALKRETDADKNFQSLLNSNVHYIKSAPLDMAERMVKHISDAHIAGRRPEQIADELQKLFPEMTKAKAKLIARTESAKASAELVQSRAERLGFAWYIWSSVKDQRVRQSHKDMQGVLVNYNDPPSPEKLAGEKSQGAYNAGNIYNCRCYASVVFDINEIDFPHKVYYHGSIRTMTKKQFREVM
jgi:SPP1 gp7 family putative phage head morphogenesis protein